MREATLRSMRRSRIALLSAARRVAPDAVLGRRAHDPASLHAGAQFRVAGGAGVGDEVVAFVDGLEHRLHVDGA
jgi:hypothetical protein